MLITLRTEYNDNYYYTQPKQQTDVSGVFVRVFLTFHSTCDDILTIIRHCGDHLNSYMAAQVKVRVCGLSLLPPRLNGGPVSDDSAAEGGMRKCGAIYLLVTSYLLAPGKHIVY